MASAADTTEPPVHFIHKHHLSSKCLHDDHHRATTPTPSYHQAPANHSTHPNETFQLGEDHEPEHSAPSAPLDASHHKSSQRRLKPWSWLFCVSIPCILGGMCLWYWQLACVSLLLFIPSLRLVWWWQQNQQHAGPLDHLISSYAQGFYLIFAISNISACLAFIAANIFLNWTVRALAGGRAWRRGGALRLILYGASWAAWVLTEESWKITFAYWAKQRRAHVIGPRNRETKAWVSAATATAFGYSTSQSILFTCACLAVLTSDKTFTRKEFGWLILFAFGFAAVSQPLSILTAYLIGLELTMDTPAQKTIVWPASIRCAFVFQIFVWLAIFNNISFFAALGASALTVICIYIALCRRIVLVEAQLPFEYMSQVSRLRRRLGFALLNADDDDVPREHELVERPSVSPFPVVADEASSAKDIVEL